MKSSPEVTQIVTEKVAVAVLNTKMDYLTGAVDNVNKKIDTLSGQFVPQSEFKPIRNLTYGLVGLILTAVVISIMTLVLRQ